MKQNVRPPAVAGMFYPDDPSILNRMIDDFMQQADETHGPVPKAIIVPHAGYIYSGPVAASAYARIKPIARQIRRVVLLGPAHRVYVQGLAATRATHFATPLGTVAIDHNAHKQISDLPQVNYNDAAHLSEHSLEVHLPFLQKLLSDFVLIPLVVGECSPADVAEVLERLWGGAETLIVISSDLSHYHDYLSAQQRDQNTSRAIESMQPERIGHEDACGRNPLNGLLEIAKRHHMHITTVDLRNSGDTAGPRDRVVGYGAYIVY